MANATCRLRAQELPDQLRGEAWAFVQLPLGVLRAELRAVEAGQAFGAAFPLDSAGLADLPDEALVPGAQQGQHLGCVCLWACWSSTGCIMGTCKLPQQSLFFPLKNNINP